MAGSGRFSAVGEAFLSQTRLLFSRYRIRSTFTTCSQINLGTPEWPWPGYHISRSNHHNWCSVIFSRISINPKFPLMYSFVILSFQVTHSYTRACAFPLPASAHQQYLNHVLFSPLGPFSLSLSLSLATGIPDSKFIWVWLSENVPKMFLFDWGGEEGGW